MIFEFTCLEKELQDTFCRDLRVHHHKLLPSSELDGRWVLFKTLIYNKSIYNKRQQEISL